MPGHPRLPCRCAVTWMPGTSPGMTNPRSGARFDWLHYSSETPRNSPRPRPCLASHPRLELGPTEGQILPRYGARRGGRVVECTALEMRHRCKPIGGSNPSLSASKSMILQEKISLAELCRDFRRLAAEVARVGH